MTGHLSNRKRNSTPLTLLIPVAFNMMTVKKSMEKRLYLSKVEHVTVSAVGHAHDRHPRTVNIVPRLVTNLRHWLFLDVDRRSVEALLGGYVPCPGRYGS